MLHNLNDLIIASKHSLLYHPAHSKYSHYLIVLGFDDPIVLLSEVSDQQLQIILQ